MRNAFFDQIVTTTHTQRGRTPRSFDYGVECAATWRLRRLARCAVGRAQQAPASWARNVGRRRRSREQCEAHMVRHLQSLPRHSRFGAFIGALPVDVLNIVVRMCVDPRLVFYYALTAPTTKTRHLQLVLRQTCFAIRPITAKNGRTRVGHVHPSCRHLAAPGATICPHLCVLSKAYRTEVFTGAGGGSESPLLKTARLRAVALFFAEAFAHEYLFLTAMIDRLAA